MDVQIVWELADITDNVISYRREHGICDGIGLFSFQVPLSSALNFDTWDYIELQEDGNLKGKYFIAEITDSILRLYKRMDYNYSNRSRS